MSFGPVSSELIGLLSERTTSGHKVYTWLDPNAIYKTSLHEAKDHSAFPQGKRI